MRRIKWMIILFGAVMLLILVGMAQSGDYVFREANGRYDIMVGDQIVGGIERYEIETSNANIKQLILDAEIFDFDKSKVDFYMIESSLHGDWLLTYGTIEKSMRHELFLRDGCFYDFWVEETAVEPEQKESIILYFVENILPVLS